MNNCEEFRKYKERQQKRRAEQDARINAVLQKLGNGQAKPDGGRQDTGTNDSQPSASNKNTKRTARRSAGK